MCLGRYCGALGTIYVLFLLMSSDSFDIYGGVVYIVGVYRGVVLFEGRGFLQFFVFFYCDMVREVLPIVL